MVTGAVSSGPLLNTEAELTATQIPVFAAEHTLLALQQESSSQDTSSGPQVSPTDIGTPPDRAHLAPTHGPIEARKKSENRSTNKTAASVVCV